MAELNFASLILVAIPTISGIITSLVITRKWQIKKQISDTRHNLMEICDDSLTTLYIKLSKMEFVIMMGYREVNDKTEIVNNKIQYADFVTNPELYPPKKRYSEKYERYVDEFITLYSTVWKLQSNMMLYIKNLEYGEKKFMAVMHTVDECQVEVLKLFAAKDIEELKKHHSLFVKSSSKLKDEINEFRAFLAIFDLKI
jgi:hypothetical protein